MGCSSCGTGGCSSGGGCQNNGLCASGSCNKMNSYDWISTLDYDDPSAYEYVEVSFKNGARKEFFKNPNHLNTGDQVLVEVNGGGYDIGVISLSGELVRLQMKKKFTQEDRVLYAIIRKANERDLEKLQNKTDLETDSMISARVIARALDLDLKIGDVEYQGDMRKATFFFTSNGRVDFRELVRAYAKEFKVKIEMRQIGSRQESARIGGIGSCGRELCCSTWLSDFRSVNTTVARYQNIAINQTKLSGQCGRLKCCLNYELDSYVDALQHFPNHANTLMTKKGKASLVKTDIFKGLMFYVYEDISMRGVFHPLDKEKVKEILAMNKKGVHPDDLTSFAEVKDEVKEIGFADVTGEIELPSNKKKKKKGSQRSDNQGGGDQRNQNRSNPNQQGQQQRPPRDQKQGDQKQPRNNQGQARPQNQEGQKPQNAGGEQGQPQNNQGQPKQQNNQGQPRPQQQNKPRPQQAAEGDQGQPQNNQGKPKQQGNNQGQPRPQQQQKPRQQQGAEGDQGQPQNNQGQPKQQGNNKGQPRPQNQDRQKQQPNKEQGQQSQNNQGQPRPQNQDATDQGTKQNNQGQPRPQNQDRQRPQGDGNQRHNENSGQSQEPKVNPVVSSKTDLNPTPQIINEAPKSQVENNNAKFDKKGGGNKKSKEKYVPKHLQNKENEDSNS